MQPDIKRTAQREESRIKSDEGEEKESSIRGNKAMGGLIKLKDGIRNLKLSF